MLFDFDDLLIEPEMHTSIRSRKQVNILDEKMMLPLFTAPMDTVISQDNIKLFASHGIYSIMPRKSEYAPDDISTDYKTWFSYGLDDFNKLFLDNHIKVKEGEKMFVLIDIANGHMKEVKESVERAKDVYGRSLVLMVGNCANPLTFLSLAQAGADYVRMGIGNGCFVPGSTIRTDKGLIPIESIRKNDYVLTHKNRFRKVLDIFIYDKDESITYINGVGSTNNHEYYVIDKEHADIVNDENIDCYTKWIPAELLDESKHLLVNYSEEKTNKKNFKLKSFKKETGRYSGKVYDLSVEEDHSYNINGVIVHNSGCLTTQQTGIGYPMASLIHEASKIQIERNLETKIVADGGFKKYSDVIKALALGADYVMLGSIFNKALESAGETYEENKKFEGWTEPGDKVDQFSKEVHDQFISGRKFFKKFRGMSTKEVQKTLGRSNLKTSEGITKMQPVEYTISGWTENFTDYLRSAMSYTDCLTLGEFIGKVRFNLITKNSLERFSK